MLNLIIKDIVIQKKTIPLALLYVVFFILVTNNAYSKGSIYIMGVTLAFIFSLGAIQYDEKYRADHLIASLPLTRTDIVISRYLGMAFFTAVSTVFMVVFVLALRVLNLMPGLESINLQDIKTIVITALVLMSIIIPLNFKLGIKKTKILNTLLYLTFFFIFLNVYENMFIEPENNGVVIFWANYGLIFSVILLVASFICSIIIYKNKDIA